MSDWDAERVKRAAKGDDEAFDELAGRHRLRIYNAAFRILGCRETAEDVTQETLVRAYMSLPALRKSGQFGSWAIGIAENLCRMHFRSRREFSAAGQIEPSVNQPPVAGIDLAERLNILPQGTRDAAQLYFVQGMKMREVSLELQISLSAVKSRIRDARGLLSEKATMKSKSQKPAEAFDQELQRRLELARWYREFGKLASSGIPVLQLLQMLGEGPYRESVKEATRRLRKAVLDGSSLSNALRRLPALRTPESATMVRAGEVGGILDRAAVVLADWIDVGSSQREIELSFWLRALGEMIDAGVPLDAALSWGIEYPANPGLRDTLKRLAAATAEGKPVASIIREAGDVLPASVRLAIAAGENARCLGFALRWAGNELAVSVCDRLTGTYPLTPSNGNRTAFAAEIARLLPEEPTDTRRAAASALGSLGTPDALRVLSESLSDPEAEVRIAAIRGLARMRAAESAPEVAACMADPEAGVRLAAVLALGAFSAKKWAPQLCEAIRDPDLPTAKAAADTVEAMGETALLTAFAIEVLSGEPSVAMFFAVDILRAHPVPEAIPALVGSLGRAPHIAITAALILAGFGRTDGVPILRETLASPFGIYVLYAAEALESLKDRESVPLIREAIRIGRLPEEWVARAERLALA